MSMDPFPVCVLVMTSPFDCLALAFLHPRFNALRAILSMPNYFFSTAMAGEGEGIAAREVASRAEQIHAVELSVGA
jgi:hypothetical protein